MLVLYALLENPNEHIDRITGLFTQNALGLYLQDKYKYDEPFSMFTARIKYLVPTTELEMRKDALLRSAKEFSKLNSDLVFVMGDDTFCVIYDSPEQAYKDMIGIKKLADGVRDVPAEARFIYFPDSRLLNDPDEVIKFIHAHENDSEEIVECTEELIQRLRHKHNIYNLIENALKEDRVVVYYQPIYNVQLGKFTAAEALVRIINRDGSLVPPGEFISVAEENGQIIPLGMRVFEKVCCFLSTNEPQKLGLERVEINISVAQFDHENPAGFIQRNINHYGVDPKCINLEITETASNDLKHILLLNMDRLIGMGVSFSLDDFGTGRSNLDYFVDMPVENIKFDYSFTQGYFKNERTRHILEGMVDIMHKMGMKIVVEGVETKEQLDAMLNMGVEFIQGFYFSRPVPEEQLIDFLEKH
jgi:EAL domain-containing protein (putative c-di-GMP-specific phosphodiesterase class I)